MIKDSAKGLFDTIIVWKLDRFSRNRYDSAHYKNILKKNGVKVISATERISDTPEGILLESMLESMLEGYAEFYSAELAVKVKRGLKENAFEPIVTPEVFNAVQARMVKNKRSSAKALKSKGTEKSPVFLTVDFSVYKYSSLT